MVAVKGSGWRLAPSLVALVEQADREFPKRDRSSDGSIGDLAHAARDSDHNPFEGWVHAVDLDEDLAPGRDLKPWVKRVEASRDPRVYYVIYEGRVLKAYPKNGLPAWSWHPYTGPNAHAHHAHVSIRRSADARDDMRAWPPFNDTPQEEDDMLVILAPGAASLLHAGKLVHIETTAAIPKDIPQWDLNKEPATWENVRKAFGNPIS